MLDSGDVEGLAVVMEAEPVVADAQTELGRLDVLKTLYVALAGSGEVGQGTQNAQAVGWSMARSWALAWSRQAMFLRPMFTVRGGAVQGRAGSVPCARNPLRSGQTPQGLPR